MTRKQLVLRLLAVGLSTAALATGVHFLGAWLAADMDGGPYRLMTFALPLIVGTVWFIPAIAIAWREEAKA